MIDATIELDGALKVSKFLELPQAIESYVKNGDVIAMEGFTHLIPFAAGHEIIRQKITDLTAVRLTPDLIYDQMIGAGCVKKLIFSWGGNPGVGSLHRFRDAYQNSWPNKIEIEEHTHAGLTNRYVAGASGIGFAVLKGYSASKVIVTVEEVVEKFEPKFSSIIIPSNLIDAISVVPNGAWPSYASDFYERDNNQYIAWDDISKDRDRFTEWLNSEIYSKNSAGK